MIRVLIATVVVAVVLVAAVYLLTGGSNKKLTANFASGVGVYPGTPVKMLGIQIGSVSKVTPNGGSVRVEMSYGSKYKIPAGAGAYLVANSLVSDRYVQISPAYTSGPLMLSGATIPLTRTASPAELDDIYSAINQLSVALGPNGANKTGAFSTLINVAAANLKGNGAALGASIKNLSDAINTLGNKQTANDLFSTVTNLRKFTDALNQSDSQVRHFNNQLAQVALHSVANFVQANAAKTHTDIVGLENITGVLVKDKAALNEALVAGPVALSNLTHGYQETTGTLGTRSNLVGLTTLTGLAAQFCDLIQTSPLANGLLGPLLGQINQVCTTIKTGASKTSAVSSSNDLSNLTNALTGAGQ
jgi:phospholipid/cholesterol/gamma-HCH transport system substrate-binding protein